MKILEEGYHGKQPPAYWWVGRRCCCKCRCVFELEKKDELVRVHMQTRVGYFVFEVQCPKCKNPVRVDYDFDNLKGGN